MTLRRGGFGICVGLVLCVAGLVTAQEPKDPPSKRKTPEKGDAVVVRGCLEGPTLQSTETATADDAALVMAPLTYQLKGDKKLLKALRAEHDGKLVAVSGILKSTLPQDNSILGKSTGRTKVTFGVGSPSGQNNPPGVESSLPVLEVKSYDGSGERCRR
jgi:hypothetical protein